MHMVTTGGLTRESVHAKVLWRNSPETLGVAAGFRRAWTLPSCLNMAVDITLSLEFRLRVLPPPSGTCRHDQEGGPDDAPAQLPRGDQGRRHRWRRRERREPHDRGRPQGC